MATVPETYRDLLTKQSFAHVATVGRDGAPQVTPVWVDFDGEHVIFNSAKGRQKDQNVRRDPRVAMAILRHSRIALTMEIYTQVPDKVTRDALRRLSDWLDHDEDQGGEARA